MAESENYIERRIPQQKAIFIAFKYVAENSHFTIGDPQKWSLSTTSMWPGQQGNLLGWDVIISEKLIHDDSNGYDLATHSLFVANEHNIIRT